MGLNLNIASFLRNMMDKKELLKLVKESKLFKAHPWHGIELWNNKEKNILNVFIEIVPENRVKYEIDKESGYLKVDRPQKFSNIIPALYGFLPQTYSDAESAKVANDSLGRDSLVGDNDPIDICVLTDKSLRHGDILLEAIPIGGFRMIDHGEVDDKIIAVLKDDATYGAFTDISQVPKSVIDSLEHYFLTYKEIPKDNEQLKVEIAEVYGKEAALQVIEAGDKDYTVNY